jgi:hypothetical protein
MMIARPANETWQIHAVAALRATRWWRCRYERRVLREWIVPIKPATTSCNGTHEATAHAEVLRNFALRQRALVEQRIDFID